MHLDASRDKPGNVSRIVTKPEASATYESVFFKYARNGRTVTHVVGEQWDDDVVTDCFPLGTHEYVNTFGWEYRYDGARARYAARGLDPDRLDYMPNPLNGWSDYDGDTSYGDFSVDASLGSFVRNKRSFEPGLGRFEWLSANEPDGSTAAYYHTDHLGTIRGVTDYIAGWGEGMTFTAFGERVVGTQNSTSTRFGYVGSFGYQASGEYPFLHVGARYYDPATGRFLQRDPVGIRGGVNVYGYVRSLPTRMADPSGLDPDTVGPWPPNWPGDFVPPYKEPTVQSQEDIEDELYRERVVQVVVGIGIGTMGLVAPWVLPWLTGVQGAGTAATCAAFAADTIGAIDSLR